MNNNSSSHGMGLLGVLQIIFIVLKCIGTIDWSWWALLTPLWIDLGFAVIIVIIFIIDRTLH